MWTLALILCVIAFIVTTIIQSSVQTKPAVYPSEALIDQVLPPEILEQIFINTDYESLITCHSVNKYWRYIASDKQLRNRLCNADKTWRVDPHELLKNWNHNRRSFDPKSLNWLEYNESYDPEWKLHDQLLARKLGKKLVDVDFNGAIYIAEELNIPLESQGPPSSMWLVKFRCKPYTYSDNHWRFSTEKGSRFLEIERRSIPKNVAFRTNVECELIVDLADVKQYSSRFSKVYQIRYINDKSPWLDYMLFNIGCGLFAPCLLVDYWQLNPSTKYWIHLVFAAIIAGSTVGLTVIVTITAFKQHRKQNGRRGSSLMTISATLLLAVFYFYNWALEIAFLCGCIYFILIYFLLLQDLVIKNHQYAKYFIGLSSILVLLTIDWRLIIGSRQIFATFGYNLLLYLLFGALLIIVMGIHESFVNSEPFVKNMFRTLDKTSMKTYCLFGMASLVYITLAAPETSAKLAI